VCNAAHHITLLGLRQDQDIRIFRRLFSVKIAFLTAQTHENKSAVFTVDRLCPAPYTGLRTLPENKADKDEILCLQLDGLLVLTQIVDLDKHHGDSTIRPIQSTNLGLKDWVLTVI
jgi:hypothetical protein